MEARWRHVPSSSRQSPNRGSGTSEAAVVTGRELAVSAGVFVTGARAWRISTAETSLPCVRWLLLCCLLGLPTLKIQRHSCGYCAGGRGALVQGRLLGFSSFITKLCVILVQHFQFPLALRAYPLLPSHCPFSCLGRKSSPPAEVGSLWKVSFTASTWKPGPVVPAASWHCLSSCP